MLQIMEDKKIGREGSTYTEVLAEWTTNQDFIQGLRAESICQISRLEHKTQKTIGEHEIKGFSDSSIIVYLRNAKGTSAEEISI